MKEKHVDPEEAMKQIQKIFKKRGTKALEMARKEILQEKIECKEAKEALTYFMTQYWHDVARPSLLSLVCETVGGDPELTTPIAISMTLISGAIDIHDDMIDQSKRKYGRPTVYGKYGKDIALLVGDALLLNGLTLLNKIAEKDIPTEKMRVIMDIVKIMFFELGDAEALELRFRGNLDVSPEEYLRVVRKKAADVEAHTRIGAILGGASPKKVEALGEYGRLLGMLIILRDDWIDVFDLEESCSRIKNESLPLLLLYGLQHSAIKDKLRMIFLKKTVTIKDAKSILETIQKTDVPQKYAKFMNKLAKDAVQNLRKHRIKNNDLELLIKTTVPL
jgi:heptaprenyl diphosphate synthase